MSLPSRTLTSLTLVTATMLSALSQSSLSLEDIRDNSPMIEKARAQVCRSNPATMVFLDSTGLSTVGISAFYSKRDMAVMQQLGTGFKSIDIAAKSYSRINSGEAVWGEAEFKSSDTKDIKWTDCIDYLRVAPYVLGDSTGGDLSSSRYSFGGGYAISIGRWSVGVQADYRAEIAYRNRDPRVKDVVSDLNISSGVAFNVSNDYAIALDIAVNTYRQNCDLEFYNPLNDINTYPLTGLGTFYNRFAGNDNKSSGYQSDGFSGGVQVINIRHKGINAEAGVTRYRMEQRLRSYNNLTLAYSDVNTIGFTASYSVPLSGRVEYSPAARFYLRTLCGFENLFGTSSGSSYDMIGKRLNYKQSQTQAIVELPFQTTVRQSVIYAGATCCYTHVTAKVMDIDRKYSVYGLTPGLTFDCRSVLGGKYLLNAGINMAFTMKSAPQSENNIISQAESVTVDGLRSCMVENFKMASADCLDTGIRGGAGVMIDKIMYFLNIDYHYQNHIATGKGHTVSFSVGACF